MKIDVTKFPIVRMDYTAPSTSTFDEIYDEDAAEGRLIDVLLDEFQIAPLEQLILPIPSDDRLKKLTNTMFENPARKETLESWARLINMSGRNMSRLFSEETGMSVNRWRRQLHVIQSIAMLAEDRPLQEIADSLGYEGASSFITMFRKILGVSPKRFIAERRAMSRQKPFYIPIGSFYEYE